MMRMVIGMRRAVSLAGALAVGLLFDVWALSGAQPPQGHALWYDRPAEDSDRGWEQESLPVGNGWFGVSVFGGVERERLQVTENTVLTRNNLTSALDLRLAFPNAEKVTDYRRQLDLETGLATVSYAADGVRYRRELFTSYPDRVLAVRLTASKPGALAFALTPVAPFLKPFGEGEAAHAGRTAEVTARADGTIDIRQHLQWFGIRFYGRVRVVTDGARTASGATLTVTNASTATVYFSCGTNYELKPETFAIVAGRENETLLKGPEPKAAVDACVAAAEHKGYDAVRQRHLADFEGLMRRTALDLGATDADRALPTEAASEVTLEKPVQRWLWGGFGFHNSEATMTPLMTDAFRDQRAYKTYREIAPSYVRVCGGYYDWTREAMDSFADYYDATIRWSGATVYLVPGRMPAIATDFDPKAYAEEVAKRLEYLVKERKCTKIRFYCISNELSVGPTYAWFAQHLDLYKTCCEEMYAAFRRHNLDIGLMTTDASGVSGLRTVEWALANVHDVTDTYCWHLYERNLKPGDLAFYDYVYTNCRRFVQMALARERRASLGEFGLCGKSHAYADGIMRDDGGYSYRNPAEAPLAAIARAEMGLAAMNAGCLHAVSWSMIDYPPPFLREDGDSPREKAAYDVARFSGFGLDIRYNKHGLFRWDDEEHDYSSYPDLYTMGHLVRLFRKGARVLTPKTSDATLRVGAVTNPDGSCSIAIVNWGGAKNVRVTSAHPLMKPLRIYEYDSAKPPYSAFNDLQPSKGTVTAADGAFTAQLPAKSLTFFTTDYQDRTPPSVTGLRLEEGTLSWVPTTDALHAYYRVYRNGKQVASTVATSIVATGDVGEYAVRSVDRWGNVGWSTPPAVVWPKGDTLVTLTPTQAQFLAWSGAERRAKFADPAYRAFVCDPANGWSNPQPQTFRWTGDGVCTVTVERVSDGRVHFRAVTAENAVAVDNFEVGGSYRWTVANGQGSDSATFATAPVAPRLLRDPGPSRNIKGVRDLGGWVGLEGRRVRQNLLFRTSGLNRKTTGQATEAGESFVTDANRAFWLDFLGVKTDLDFRSEEERMFLTASPLGPTVAFCPYGLSSYDGMFTKWGIEAFKGAFAVLLDASKYPIAFHCVAGQDRTGCFAYIVNGILGVGEDDLMKDWEATIFWNGAFGPVAEGHKYIDKFRKNLTQYPGTNDNERCCYYVTNVCGVTSAQLETFRAHMLDGYEPKQ